MSELTVTTFVSLDGVMQGPGGPDEDRSGGFDRGGWVTPYFSEEGGAFITEWLGKAGSFLLGRRTFQIFESYWPHITDQNDVVASQLNTLPKVVASTTLDHSDWTDTTFIKSDLVSRVAELKEQPGGELQVHGSGDLLQTLMAHNLIDEYRVLIFPAVVGQGRRLFPDNGPAAALSLVQSKVTDTGVQVNVYRPAGPLQTGTMAADNT